MTAREAFDESRLPGSEAVQRWTGRRSARTVDATQERGNGRPSREVLMAGTARQAKGKANKVAGSAKKAVGKATKDRSLQAKGSAQKAKGAVQGVAGKVERKVRGTGKS